MSFSKVPYEPNHHPPWSRLQDIKSATDDLRSNFRRGVRVAHQGIQADTSTLESLSRTLLRVSLRGPKVNKEAEREPPWAAPSAMFRSVIMWQELGQFISLSWPCTWTSASNLIIRNYQRATLVFQDALFAQCHDSFQRTWM